MDTKYYQVKKFRAKAPETYLPLENKLVDVLQEIDDAAKRFNDAHKNGRKR
ncbi:MAG: hypothetical protein WC325_08240 [Candidatus Bathyarchaeia archaeon]